MTLICRTCGRRRETVPKQRRDEREAFCGLYCKTIWYAWTKEPAKDRPDVRTYRLRRLGLTEDADERA